MTTDELRALSRDPGDRVDPDPASAQLILDAIAEGQVLALPPEPAVGSTVEILDGPFVGQRATRLPKWGRWHPDGVFSPLSAYAWIDLLLFAGPAGVRVLPAEGGQRQDCPAHGPHPHEAHGGRCLDCPQCIRPSGGGR
jgi:hypothetical protein